MGVRGSVVRLPELRPGRSRRRFPGLRGSWVGLAQAAGCSRLQQLLGTALHHCQHLSTSRNGGCLTSRKSLADAISRQCVVSTRFNHTKPLSSTTGTTKLVCRPVANCSSLYLEQTVSSYSTSAFCTSQPHLASNAVSHRPVVSESKRLHHRPLLVFRVTSAIPRTAAEESVNRNLLAHVVDLDNRITRLFSDPLSW